MNARKKKDLNDMLKSYSWASKLKTVERDGWVRRGVQSPESVADHSFSVTLLALWVLRIYPHLTRNPQKVVYLLLPHDLVESQTGDINTYMGTDAEKLEKKRLKKKKERAAIGKLRRQGRIGRQTAASAVEFERGRTKEARLAREIDKIDALIQAACYAKAGQPSEPWAFWKTVRDYVRTPELLEFLDEVVKPYLRRIMNPKNVGK